MKKYFALLMLCIVVMMPSCNDDEDLTKNDSYLTSQLIGSWLYEYTNKDYTRTEKYTFTKTEFIHYSYYSNKWDHVEKSYTVRGTWNVYKGVLQLVYNTEIVETEGFSEKEALELREELHGQNLTLEQMNAEGRAFGSQIWFDKSGDTQVLNVEGVNGYFKRVY